MDPKAIAWLAAAALALSACGKGQVAAERSSTSAAGDAQTDGVIDDGSGPARDGWSPAGADGSSDTTAPGGDASDSGKGGASRGVDVGGVDTPTPTNSCVGTCGKTAPGAICHCDAGCPPKKTCCADYMTVCKPPKGDVDCGNGVCDIGETKKNCAQDCYKAPAPGLPCLLAQCKTRLHPCTATEQCSAALACVLSCDSAACAQKCAVGITNVGDLIVWQNLAKCGGGVVEGGCIPKAWVEIDVSVCDTNACTPGDYTPACPKACGVWADGKCDEGESWRWDTGDCGGIPTSEAQKCMAAKCPQLWSTCAKFGYCGGHLLCMEQHLSWDVCLNPGAPGGFTAGSLTACGLKAGCFKKAEEISCKGSCGKFVAGRPCQCASMCQALNNCCPDFVSVCVTSP